MYCRLVGPPLMCRALWPMHIGFFLLPVFRLECIRHRCTQAEELLHFSHSPRGYISAFSFSPPRAAGREEKKRGPASTPSMHTLLYMIMVIFFCSVDLAWEEAERNSRRPRPRVANRCFPVSFNVHAFFYTQSFKIHFLLRD